MEAKTHISDSEDTAVVHVVKLSKGKKKLKAVLEKINDLEKRSQWCNILVIELPESSEGGGIDPNIAIIVTQFLSSTLRFKSKSRHVFVKWVHILYACPLLAVIT